MITITVFGGLARRMYLTHCPTLRLTTPDHNKVYMGFLNGATPPGLQAIQALFSNAVASNDAWFLSLPAGTPIVPLRMTDCADVSLTPRTDPNPPHNVHPKVRVTVNFWDSNNALMWITNDSGRNVTFYIEIFHKAFLNQPPTF